MIIRMTGKRPCDPPACCASRQACLLEQWLEVAALTREQLSLSGVQRALAPAAAEPRHLEKLNRPCGGWTRPAWRPGQAYQALLALPGESERTHDQHPELPRAVNLKPWAMIRKSVMSGPVAAATHSTVLPDVLQQAGFAFECGDFIQLAGNTLRLSSGRMLPRATGWIPLGGPAQRDDLFLTRRLLDP
jgi:hypothetical protein